MKHYPKILIIGQSFHKYSGGGITLSNLFSQWPRQNIAYADDYIYSNQPSDFKGIDTFQLYKKKKIFKLIDYHVIGMYSVILEKNNETITKLKKISLKVLFKNLFFWFLEFTNLSQIIYSYKIDDELINWIHSFKPDYIYSQLSTRELIAFISKISKKLQIPLAIHIMDDWPKTIGSVGLFKKYWSQKIDKEFKELLNQSNILLSISESMSEEYFTRYGKLFTPFHNPVDLSMWENSINKSPKSNESIIFLHAGRIGTGITSSLLDIARTLQELNDENIPVYLHLQSSKIDIQFRNRIIKFSCVKINPPVEYNKIPGIMKNADILVLCNDFDEKGKNFLKFSMPTKASEYMISGVPILVYSDYSSAVYKDAEKNGWAYLVGEHNNSLLKTSIIDLIENTELRKSIAKRAFQYAICNFDSKIINEKFRTIFR